MKLKWQKTSDRRPVTVWDQTWGKWPLRGPRKHWVKGTHRFRLFWWFCIWHIWQNLLTDDWLNFMLKSSEFYSVYYPSSRFFKNQNNSKMTWVSVFGPHSKCTGLITGSELRDHFWKVLMGLCGTRIKPSAFTCKQCLTCNTVSQAPIMCFLIFYIVYSCKWLFLLL